MPRQYRFSPKSKGHKRDPLFDPDPSDKYSKPDPLFDPKPTTQRCSRKTTHAMPLPIIIGLLILSALMMYLALGENTGYFCFGFALPFAAIASALVIMVKSNPILFISGLGMFILLVLGKRLQRQKRVSADRSIHELYSLSATEFEKFVGELYRAKGYTVQEVGGTGDKGIDLILVDRDGYHHAVQCKRYKDLVSPQYIREFAHAISASRSLHGILVTTGRVSDETYRYAESNNVEIVDGDKLAQMMTKSISPDV
jgi:HJR/Mrr/RecB family endonuclease